ncbi:MAG: hypothetical protein RBG13Loki_0726 [Promethearchaeota archaeon CR_4]|nr:MAG: hypothetical protein RBG13Loki_0726 [Candidatus Lokiarchaeota archaeon CR_4]
MVIGNSFYHFLLFPRAAELANSGEKIMFPGKMTSFFFTKTRTKTISIQDPESKKELARIDSEDHGKNETDFFLKDNEGTELGRFREIFSWRKIYALIYLADSPEPRGELRLNFGLSSFSFKLLKGKKLYKIKFNWKTKKSRVISLLLKGKPEIAIGTKIESYILNPTDYPFKLDINPATDLDTRILLLMFFPSIFEMKSPPAWVNLLDLIPRV